MGKIIPYAIGAAVIYFIWKTYNTGKAFANQAAILIQSIKVAFPSIYTTTLTVKIRVQNPTGQAVSLKSLSGDLFFNGISLGNISYLQPINIDKYAYSDISLPINISNLTLLTNSPDILTSFAKGVNLDVKGGANFSFGSVPFSQSIIAKTIG